jgi:CO/xanthine dehydrogenase Mo-binding subunit
MTKYSVIGQRLPRVDAATKLTGQAKFAADFTLPNMLWGKVLWSPYPHANIRQIDVSEAAALNGVKAVITAADVPKKKDDEEYPGAMSSCLARNKVIFAGQPVAAVAAINQYVAEEALALIKVEYEVLPAVIDIEEAMKPGAPLVHPNTFTMNIPEKDQKPTNIFWYSKIEKGNIDAGFRQADVVLENVYRTQVVHHGYLEPRASMANVEPDGKVTIWSDNQGIFELREIVAGLLNIPFSKLKVIPVEVGGAFGGKSSQIVAPLCVLLSGKSGLPVKIVTSREETFKTNRPAPAALFTVKIGATKDGTITGAYVKMVYDFGALSGIGGMGQFSFGGPPMLNTYRIPNIKIDNYSVYTNKTPSGPYRGPTATQAAFAIESQLDEVARALKIDPVEFRLKNVSVDGDPMNAPGFGGDDHFGKIGFKPVMEQMKKYLNKRGPVKGSNCGRGVSCGYWATASGSAGAIINLNADGTLDVLIGSVDVSGTRTIAAQVVAEELGVPYEKVTVNTGDTDVAPYSTLSAGSMIARSISKPLHLACQDIIAQLCERAAPLLEVRRDDLEYTRGQVQIKGKPDKALTLAEIGGKTFHFPGGSPIIGRGSTQGSGSSPVIAMSTVDVEVDKETGKVKITNFATIQDTGCSINPTLIEGQQQGAAAQGIGWALMEKSVYQNGVIQNATFLDYRVPTAVDLPYIDAFAVEIEYENSPFGIRGAGEPPLVPTVAAIANAIRDATGVRMKEVPMTPETVFWALQKKEK